MSDTAETRPDDLESCHSAIRKLEAKVRQLNNDLKLTQQENHDNSLRYLELMEEVSDKNRELEQLRQSLEERVREQTAELRANTEELKQRDVLLQASTQIATSLLEREVSINTAILSAMNILAKVLEIDGISLLSKCTDCANDELEFYLYTKWCHHGDLIMPPSDPTDHDRSRLNIPNRWLELLRKNLAVPVNIKDPHFGASHLSRCDQKISPKSALLVPFRVGGIFSGVLIFGSCDPERTWPQSEIAILSSVGSAMASAIERENVRQDLMRAKKAAETSAEEARKATQAKSEFLANMSHELRTPLNGVIGISELLRRTELTETQREYTDDLRFSSESLLAIINDILDFSKIEAGKLQLEETSFSLSALLQKLHKMLRHQAEKKGLKLKLELDQEFPAAVVGDSVRIRQIIINLVSNAVKFTSTGQVTIIVKGIKLDEQMILMSCSVKDTGVGIPEDKVRTLFSKFVQADTSITRKFGGTGLGLSICKLLTEKMGGEIGIESEEGVGTEIFFSIPMRVTDVQPATEELQAEEALPVWERPPRILVTDDGMINQKVACNLLQDYGCETDVADNGMVSFEKFSSEDYDMILMDVQMPIQDGITTTQQIRAYGEKGENTVIVGLSANALPENVERCMDAGMDDYLTKPLDAVALLKVLKKWLIMFLVDTTKAEVSSKEQTDGDTPVFDLASALARVNDNQGLLQELLEWFFTSTPETLDTIEQHLDNGDFEEASKVFHSLKGGSANLSAKRFSSIAAKGEKAADKEDRSTAEECVRQMRLELAEVKAVSQRS